MKVEYSSETGVDGDTSSTLKLNGEEITLKNNPLKVLLAVGFSAGMVVSICALVGFGLLVLVRFLETPWAMSIVSTVLSVVILVVAVLLCLGGIKYLLTGSAEPFCTITINTDTDDSARGSSPF